MADERRDAPRVGDPDAGAIDPAADDPAAGMDVGGFARADGYDEGREAALAGGAGDLGGGGDLAGDSGGLAEEGDEGSPA